MPQVSASEWLEDYMCTYAFLSGVDGLSRLCCVSSRVARVFIVRGTGDYNIRYNVDCHRKSTRYVAYGRQI